MLLEQIKDPQDIKRLKGEEVEKLAEGNPPVPD